MNIKFLLAPFLLSSLTFCAQHTNPTYFVHDPMTPQGHRILAELEALLRPSFPSEDIRHQPLPNAAQKRLQAIAHQISTHQPVQHHQPTARSMNHGNNNSRGAQRVLYGAPNNRKCK